MKNAAGVESGIYGSKSSDAMTMSALIFAAAGPPGIVSGIGTDRGTGTGIGTKSGTASGMRQMRNSAKEQDNVSLIEGTDKSRLGSIDWADVDAGSSGMYDASTSSRDGAVPTQYMGSTDSLTDVALAPESITPGAYQPPIEKTVVLNRDNAALKLKTAWYAKNNKVMFATSPTNSRKIAPPVFGTGTGTGLDNIPSCCLTSRQSHSQVEVERGLGSLPIDSDLARKQSSEYLQRIHLKGNTVTPTNQRRKKFQTPPTQFHINVKGQPRERVSSEDAAEVSQCLSGTDIIAGGRVVSPTSRHKAATHKLVTLRK